MIAIAAVTSAWGIGKDNALPFHLKEDMKRFRALTSGGTVIMGRKTLDSLPNGKPLPNRRNIVITRDLKFSRENVEVAYSVEEAISMTREEDPEHVWVCGGGQIYKAMLPFCDRVYLTKVNTDLPCDVYFPGIDNDPAWEFVSAEPEITEGDVTYRFASYRRKSDI